MGMNIQSTREESIDAYHGFQNKRNKEINEQEIYTAENDFTEQVQKHVQRME